MKIKVTSYSEQSSLISSILSFILGAVLFTQAEAVLDFVSISIGIILSVIAIVQIIFMVLEIKKDELFKKSRIFSISLSIFLAIIFIFFASIVEKFIRLIVGGWILFSGIMRFISCLSISPKAKRFLPLLIVSLLLMATGIYTIINDAAGLKILGIIMMLYSIIEIIGYIFYTKDNLEPEEPGSTTLIVPDENNSNEKNDKVVKTIKEKDIKPKKEKKTKKKKDE